MLRIRVIPSLLLANGRLVKTVQFSNPRYIGDPLNAVRIFNEKEVDELLIVDTMATIRKENPRFDLIGKIASECFMPLGYCGGIRGIHDVSKIFSLGVEKVGANSLAVQNPEFIREASSQFGSQSIFASIDVRQISGKYKVCTEGGRIVHDLDPVVHAINMETMGAGEILLTSIDRDGLMAGYDLDLIRNVATAVHIPVIACGGAGALSDFKKAVTLGRASAVSAGSMFVFYGKHRAVLINYPSQEELTALLGSLSPDDKLSINNLPSDHGWTI